jgi:hypothetical protein
VIGDDDGGSARGATYILFLGANGSVLSQRKISNTTGGFTAALSDNDDFGEDVAGLGDLDGPGPSAGALAATAVGDDDGSNDAGAVYILFLDTTGLVLSHRKISSTTGGFTGTLSADDNFGTAVANLGDLDGSGPSAIAIAVGSGGHDGAGVDRGAEYTLLLDATGLVLSHVEISSTAGFGAKLDDTDEFASALVALGDIDGQGPARQTLAAAASFDDDGGPDRGAVYLLSLDGSANVGVPGTALPSLLSTLGAARPNPFRAETTIPFRLAESGAVRIRIVDVRGRRVRDLIQYARAGEHRVVWDGLDDSGRPSAPGSYYIQLAVNGRTLAGERAVRLR